MKTLLKTYYEEPKVDSRILTHILEKKPKKYSTDLFLLPIIGIGILILVFASFLLDLNREFLGVVINLYTTIEGIRFLVFNVIVGVLLFIMRHGDIIVPYLMLLFVGQAGILGLHSIRKI